MISTSGHLISKFPEVRFHRTRIFTISIRDMAGKEKKENFYHGILLGLLNYKENWLVKSNAESGEGYSDILVEVPESRTGIVIELKYAKENQLRLYGKAGRIADQSKMQKERYDMAYQYLWKVYPAGWGREVYRNMWG